MVGHTWGTLSQAELYPIPWPLLATRGNVFLVVLKLVWRALVVVVVVGGAVVVGGDETVKNSETLKATKI